MRKASFIFEGRLFLVVLFVGRTACVRPTKPYADTFDVMRTHSMCPYRAAGL